MTEKLNRKGINPPTDKNIIDAIDERLEMLEKEKEEIEKKFGLDQNFLKTFSFTDNLSQNTYMSKTKQHKPKKINYEKLTKINNVKYEQEPLINNYKTPDKLMNSLKYEPNINELLDQENFKPVFTSLNTNQTTLSNPRTYEINDYLSDFVNQEFIKDVLH